MALAQARQQDRAPQALEPESTERNVGFLIHDVARLMRVNHDRRMRQLGLTRSQWWVMTFVYFNEGISQSELSAMLDVERATLGRLLDRLEEKGWLERRGDAQDRRVKRVYLTGVVEPMMRQMRQMAAEARTEALDGLSPAAREMLIDTLIHMKQNLLVAHEGNGNGNSGLDESAALSGEGASGHD